MSTAGWSIDTLKQHFDQRLVDQDKAVQAALAAAEKAVSAALVAAERAREAAEANSEKWRQNANEWRAAMQDRETRFASRLEIEAELKSMNAKIESLEQHVNQRTGVGMGANQMWGYIVGAIGLLLTVVMLFDRFSK